MDKSFWNERFGGTEYIYGTEPNEYFREKISGLKPGRILFVAEGEGRNSVYAATLGWQVDAFDQSEAGKQKALSLARREGVTINYKVAGADQADYPENTFDAAVLIYAHFPESVRRAYHQKIANTIKPGGALILEAFSKKHVQKQKENPRAGGPRVPDILYDLEEVKKDFTGFSFEEAVESETVLSEGEFHKGSAIVVRIFAKKK